MINVVASNHAQTSGKLYQKPLSEDDYFLFRQKYLEKTYEESSKLEATSMLLGVGGGLLSKYVNKKNDAIGIGIITYLVSNLLLSLYSTHKNNKEAKKAYQNYQKEYQEIFKPKNKFDAFVSSISNPKKMDFSDENMNKLYYFTAKKELAQNNKINLMSIGAGILSGFGTAGFCYLKKSSNKLIKSIAAGAIVTTTMALISHTIKDIKNIKRFKNQLSQKD